MDLDLAREFIHENHLAVSRPAGGTAAIKVRNLRRDPYVQLCVFENRWPGQWMGVDGEAEILSLPEAVDPLIDYNKRFPDENPDWDDYRERMRRKKRVLVRIELRRAGPDRQG